MEAILFLSRVGLCVSLLPLVNGRGKTSWHEGLPVVKTIYTYGFHELFLNCNMETPWKPLNKYWCSVPHYLSDIRNTKMYIYKGRSFSFDDADSRK
jgi:hypothetical protein